MPERQENYRPPQSCAELLQRYANGERCFPDTDLSDVDFSGATLDGARFETLSWFSNCIFDGASLRETSFRECHVKGASFRNADLTGALFELATVEATDFLGATMDGVSLWERLPMVTPSKTANQCRHTE